MKELKNMAANSWMIHPGYVESHTLSAIQRAVKKKSKSGAKRPMRQKRKQEKEAVVCREGG